MPEVPLLSKQPPPGPALAMGVGAPLRPRPPGLCPGGCAEQRGGPEGQECAAGGRAAQEASGGTCKGTSRQQPPSAQTEHRGAGVRAARRRAPGRGSRRSERCAGSGASIRTRLPGSAVCKAASATGSAGQGARPTSQRQGSKSRRCRAGTAGIAAASSAVGTSGRP